jgi:UDP-N-acetylmuramoyl-L-alanyl-D-glutamate--2,6-diaminopimelate ligase
MSHIVANSAPREIASKENAPEPAKRSSTVAPSIPQRDSSVENNDSRTLEVVGRATVLGTNKLLPLNSPEMTLILYYNIWYNNSTVKLNELIETSIEADITGVSVNSATLKPGDLFLAIQGAGADRHDYLDDAAQKGAAAAVVSKDVDLSIPTIKVEDVNDIADEIFQKFYNNVQDELHLLAVTGTDGKTSVSTIIWQLLGEDKAIVVGTNGMLYKEQRRTSFNTTPDSHELYDALRHYKDQGAQYAVMEFSSEAQHFGRLNNLEFDVVGLTNITSEHLNTHGTLKNYISAKTDIFLKHLKLGHPAVLNADDDGFSDVYEALSEYGVPMYTYGSQDDADLQVESYVADMSGTRIKLRLNNDELAQNGNHLEFDSPLLGDFNVENLACAVLMLLVSGHRFEDIAPNIAKINIAGRLDMVDLGQDFHVMVDYAHTPNGITRLLNFVDEMPGVKRIITVIGQAGERDKSKRSEVGQIVAAGSDLSVFTEEDPKNEPVHETIADITQDLSRDEYNWVEIHKRGDAIKYAINEAKTGDLVLVLGKGVEDFMKVGNEKIHYSDAEEVDAALRERLENEGVENADAGNDGARNDGAVGAEGTPS